MRHVVQRAAAGFVLAAAFVLSGCSINPALRVSESMPSSGALLLDDVPFHPQTAYQCGPAALAGILGASGVAVAPETLTPQVYLPERRGSLQLELVAATRRAGRIPYAVEPTPEALFAELGAGRPVLVLQNLLVPSVPKWHYAVVVGADPARNRIILNSGTTRGLRMRAPRFRRTWDWGGRWGLVALRPGELPARADPARYLAAVADFEAVAGADAAVPAYEAAARQWPQDARPHLALGNQAHARGDRATAARHYRAGLALAPADPVLGNNYASTLGELGCRAEARAALQAARAGLDPASPWRKALADTERELEQGKQPRSPACAEPR